MKLLLVVATGLGCAASFGQFFDDFNSGASGYWGNEYGAWGASGGVYSASGASNFPNAATSLPWVVADGEIEADINAVSDGGIWIRSSNAGGVIGRVGVLLVTKNNSLYWHVVTDPNSYGGSLGFVSGFFNQGDNIHIKVKAVGNDYFAYLNGSSTALTGITNASFSTGQFALYDFSAQTFDNVYTPNGVAEPATLAVLGLGSIAILRKRRR